MKQVKIADQRFDILTQYEAIHETKGCDHDWEQITKEVIVNPAREFVRGYGSKFVSVEIATGRICRECGLLEVGNELETAIKTGKFDRILKRPREINHTICSLLRDLHEQIEDQAQQEIIDICLLIAKKMNDKLVQYVGVNRLAEWYDDDGNFIE